MSTRYDKKYSDFHFLKICNNERHLVMNSLHNAPPRFTPTHPTSLALSATVLESSFVRVFSCAVLKMSPFHSHCDFGEELEVTQSQIW